MTALETEDRDSREKILAAARTRFANDGFSGASVREIAADAGVAKPMVFYYFGSKDELFRAVVDASVDALNRRYEHTVRTAASARDALAGLARAHLDVAANAGDHIRFLARCVLTVGSDYGESFRKNHYVFIDRVLDMLETEGTPILDREAARQLIRGVFSTYYMDVVSGASLNPSSPDTFAHMIWRALSVPEENESSS